MRSLSKLAYIFLGVIILGLIIQIIEFLTVKTAYGLTISLIGLVGEVLTFVLHVSETRPKQFKWRISHVALIAIILIAAGIIINIVCLFICVEHMWIGNQFITWGFIIAVLGFFIFVVKEKAFKQPSRS